MPFIAAHNAPTFELHGASFTGLAAPSRGATETAVWLVKLQPHSPATPHRLTREETFVVLEGRAVAHVNDESFELTPGSALVVPADALFALGNPHDAPFRAVAVLPVGGQAVLPGGAPFTPPWAA